MTTKRSVLLLRRPSSSPSRLLLLLLLLALTIPSSAALVAVVASASSESGADAGAAAADTAAAATTTGGVSVDPSSAVAAGRREEQRGADATTATAAACRADEQDDGSNPRLIAELRKQLDEAHGKLEEERQRRSANDDDGGGGGGGGSNATIEVRALRSELASCRDVTLELETNLRRAFDELERRRGRIRELASVNSRLEAEAGDARRQFRRAKDELFEVRRELLVADEELTELRSSPAHRLYVRYKEYRDGVASAGRSLWTESQLVASKIRRRIRILYYRIEPAVQPMKALAAYVARDLFQQAAGAWSEWVRPKLAGGWSRLRVRPAMARAAEFLRRRHVEIWDSTADVRSEIGKAASSRWHQLRQRLEPATNVAKEAAAAAVAHLEGPKMLLASLQSGIVEALRAGSDLLSAYLRLLSSTTKDSSSDGGAAWSSSTSLLLLLFRAAEFAQAHAEPVVVWSEAFAATALAIAMLAWAFSISPRTRTTATTTKKKGQRRTSFSGNDDDKKKGMVAVPSVLKKRE